MSCNCNNRNCQPPVQHNYNLLDKGYIFKKDNHNCDCQNSDRNEVEEDDITVPGLFNAGLLNYHYLKFGNICTLVVEDLQLNNTFTEQYYPIPFAAAKESTIRICGIDEENIANVELIATILSSTTNEDVNTQLGEINPSCLVIRRHDRVLYDPAYSTPLPNGYVSFTIIYKTID